MALQFIRNTNIRTTEQNKDRKNHPLSWVLVSQKGFQVGGKFTLGGGDKASGTYLDNMWILSMGG